MNLMDYFVIVNFILTAITLAGTAWNNNLHKTTKLLLAEMQLNMKREMNGKYLTIERFEDYKEYAKKLEASHGLD